ncbi:MAG: hypothetical protein NT076_02215 [Candidatus Pacearchaeota archaeon]|nr:hypothetical protein [Candidatus Pacearchaeota archaeon]
MGRELIFKGQGNLNPTELSDLTGVTVTVLEGDGQNRQVVGYELPINPAIEEIIKSTAKQRGCALVGTNRS